MGRLVGVAFGVAVVAASLVGCSAIWGFEDAHLATVVAEAGIKTLEASTGIDSPIQSPPTLSVTNAKDSGQGSLRDILAAAPAGATIVFDPSVSGATITLNSPVTVRSNVQVHGPGSSALALSGADTSQIFDIYATVDLEGLTLTKGHSEDRGGAVRARAGSTLSVKNVVFTSNHCAGGYGRGGAVAIEGSADLESVVFDANLADYYGGGVYIETSARVSMSDLRFYGNQSEFGGALSALGSGIYQLSHGVFGNNTASAGGAIFVGSGSLVFTNGVVIGNRDGLETYAHGLIQLVNVSVTTNTAALGAYLDAYGHVNDAGASFDVRYSNFLSNGATPFVGASDPTGANGNISSDPMFVDVSSDAGEDWDLHLKAGSPLVRSGDPAINNTDGTRSDIGYYGGTW